MEARISLVTLGVADVAASRRYYERLGWKASSVGGEEVAFFQAGGMIVSLYGRADLAKDMGMEDTPEFGGDRPFPGIALAYNVRTREEVDAVLAEAVAAGGRLLKPGQDAFWGGYFGYFADPDGHVWEVAWNPGFPLRDDGTITLPE